LHSALESQVTVPEQVSGSSTPATSRQAPGAAPSHLRQAPSQRSAQQTQSVQAPLMQCESALQGWPTVRLQSPSSLHTKPPRQLSGSSAPVTGTHTPGAAPSQRSQEPPQSSAQHTPSLQMSLRQIPPLPQASPSGLTQLPRPSQTSLAGQASTGSRPLGTSAQSPSRPSTEQIRHGPGQDEEAQHTPSTHQPLAHSDPAPQASPSGRTHRPSPSQLSLPAHSS